MNPTTISEIYSNFLSKITDYSLLNPNLSDAEIDEELFGYFKTARSKFRKCKNSLKTIENELGELTFEVELDQFEIEIISHLMLVEYMNPLLASSETLKQSLSDKDFKIYSQANQIRELRLLKKEFKAEANKMITEYTYIDLNEVKQNDKR